MKPFSLIFLRFILTLPVLCVSPCPPVPLKESQNKSNKSLQPTGFRPIVSPDEIHSDTRSMGQRRSGRFVFRRAPFATRPVGQMRQSFASLPVRACYKEFNMVRSLFAMPVGAIRRSLCNLQTQRPKVKRPTLKRIAIAALILSAILIQAYLETSLGFTPNH